MADLAFISRFDPDPPRTTDEQRKRENVQPPLRPAEAAAERAHRCNARKPLNAEVRSRSLRVSRRRDGDVAGDSTRDLGVTRPAARADGLRSGRGKNRDDRDDEQATR